MPKPVKKRTTKAVEKAPKRSLTLDDNALPATIQKAVRKAKRPSSDPVSRAKQLQAEHEAKVAGATPPWTEAATLPPVIPFAEQLSAHMRALGAKGGKVSGAKRMEMPEKQRRAIAVKAAAARWGKKRGSDGK